MYAFENTKFQRSWRALLKLKHDFHPRYAFAKFLASNLFADQNTPGSLLLLDVGDIRDFNIWMLELRTYYSKVQTGTSASLSQLNREYGSGQFQIPQGSKSLKSYHHLNPLEIYAHKEN